MVREGVTLFKLFQWTFPRWVGWRGGYPFQPNSLAHKLLLINRLKKYPFHTVFVTRPKDHFEVIKNATKKKYFLIRSSGFLSFHQMCAHSTLKTTHKILSIKEPVELFQAISNSRLSADRPRRIEPSQTDYKLSISRESYLYQTVNLFFSLPENLQAIYKLEEFKKNSKACVASNISIYM